MKKTAVCLFIFSFFLTNAAFARDHVVINDQTYEPEPAKKPSINLDAALGETAPNKNRRMPNVQSTQNGTRAPVTKPQGAPQFTPQGQRHSTEIVRAQREKQRTIEEGPVAANNNPIADPERQYQILGNLFYTRMVLEAEEKVMALRRKRLLDEKKFKEEISIKSDIAGFEQMIGVGLPQNAQPLPVINPPEPKPVEAPKPRNPNEEPPLRVVGIQGYQGKFTAQIMNNGGITNVSPGMNLENGVQVVSISEDGVKVRRTRDLGNGESQTEVITLPLSR